MYIGHDDRIPVDIRSTQITDLKLVQIDSVVELNDIKVYIEGRKIPAWKAINASAVKSYTEGVPIAIPCECDDTDIFVDFSLGYCIRQGKITINRGHTQLNVTIAVFPEKFKFPIGYDIIRLPNGEIRMLSCSTDYARGMPLRPTLIIWLGPNQTPPVIGKCNERDNRFPIPINAFNMLVSIKVIDCENRKNKYPTPINAYTKIIKAALKSIKEGAPVYFQSIKADFEFVVDFSSCATTKARTGFIHLSDITNSVTYEIRAQFPTNYII
ncbi:hypothetical protein F-S17_0464 [Faustovirus]|nr:hypothetical protein F-S17_0464 [Faustovirus]